MTDEALMRMCFFGKEGHMTGLVDAGENHFGPMIMFLKKILCIFGIRFNSYFFVKFKLYVFALDIHRKWGR